MWTGIDSIADLACDFKSWSADELSALAPIFMSMKSYEKNISSVPHDTDDYLLLKCSQSHDDEHGDDYQEQIVMADKGSMEHWSIIMP